MLAHSWAILVDRKVSPFPSGSFAERVRTAICATRPWLICNAAKIAKAADSPKRTRKGSLQVAVQPEMQDALQQFGKKLKLNVGTVKTRAYRARAAVREQLAAAGVERSASPSTTRLAI